MSCTITQNNANTVTAVTPNDSTAPVAEGTGSGVSNNVQTESTVPLELTPVPLANVNLADAPLLLLQTVRPPYLFSSFLDSFSMTRLPYALGTP